MDSADDECRPVLGVSVSARRSLCVGLFDAFVLSVQG